MGGDGAMGKDIFECQTLGWLTLYCRDRREEIGRATGIIWGLDKRQKVCIGKEDYGWG